MGKTVILLAAILWAGVAIAGPPVLKWDASTGTVKGYNVYYKPAGGTVPESKDVGNVTQYPLASLSLELATVYDFTVRAYNNEGQESGDSNVATFRTYGSPDLDGDGDVDGKDLEIFTREIGR